MSLDMIIPVNCYHCNKVAVMTRFGDQCWDTRCFKCGAVEVKTDNQEIDYPRLTKPPLDGI